MTIKELLNQGIIMLKNEGIEYPKNKARAILEYTLKKSREYLIIYDKKVIRKIITALIFKIILSILSSLKFFLIKLKPFFNFCGTKNNLRNNIYNKKINKAI